MSSNSIEEENLLRLLEAHPKQGVSKLYDRYGAAIYGFILKNTFDISKANEMLCKVFLEFYKQLPVTGKFKKRIFICLYRITLKFTSS